MKRGLTPTQTAELIRAARTLAPAAREAFFAAVDSRLVGIGRRLTDDDVQSAIVATLGDNQTTTCFLCDSAPTEEPIMATNDDDDYVDAFDERGLLRDGKRARVSIMMRDAALARDATTRRGFDDRRPGPVYCGDRRAAAKAYEDAVRASENAWKMLPEPTEAADARRRRRVTTRDPFGHETGTEEWEEDAASVLPPTTDAVEGARRKQRAYDAMVREVCDAWRNPSPLPVATDAAPPPHRDAVPVPRIIRDAAEARQVKRAAYDEMVRESQDAWRNL